MCAARSNRVLQLTRTHMHAPSNVRTEQANTKAMAECINTPSLVLHVQTRVLSPGRNDQRGIAPFTQTIVCCLCKRRFSSWAP